MLIIKKEKGNISGVHKMKFDLLPVIARSVRFLKKSGAASYSGAFNNAGFFFVLKNYFLVIIVSPEILINKIKLIAG